MRDLGGLLMGGGGTTPLGRVVRSDNPSRLTAFLLQAIAGVTADAMAEDWSHSIGRLMDDPLAGDTPVSQILERAGSTVNAAIRSALDMDVESQLTEGGLSTGDLASVRHRLLG